MIRHLGAIKTEYGQMVQALSLIKGLNKKSRLKVFEIAVSRLNKKNDKVKI